MLLEQSLPKPERNLGSNAFRIYERRPCHAQQSHSTLNLAKLFALIDKSIKALEGQAARQDFEKPSHDVLWYQTVVKPN